MPTQAPRALRAPGRTRRLATLLVFLLTPSLAAAQTGALAGTVVDGDFGGGLPGASILVVDQGTGAATDLDRAYRVERLPTGSYTTASVATTTLPAGIYVVRLQGETATATRRSPSSADQSRPRRPVTRRV